MFILIVLWCRPKAVKYHKPTVSAICTSKGLQFIHYLVIIQCILGLIISVVEADLFLYLLKID